VWIGAKSRTVVPPSWLTRASSPVDPSEETKATMIGTGAELVDVGDAVGVLVAVGLAVGVGALVAVSVGVGVFAAVGVPVGGAVAVAVSVATGVDVSVGVVVPTAA
jgi:hypothetical protein